MNQRGQYFIWGLLICLSFAAGGYWFLTNFEQVEESYTTSEEEEARNNRYLAAERFLSLHGMQTESKGMAQLVDDMPATNQVVFVPDHRASESLTSERQEVLHDWMSDGGHLILVAHDVWDEEKGSSGDEFLDAFGIQKHLHTVEAGAAEPGAYIETRFAGYGDNLKVSFIPHYYMVDSEEAAYAAIQGDVGYHLLQFAVGNGLLTVLSDDWIWCNCKIGKYDHAIFMHNLIVSDVTEGVSKLWIIRDLQFPSLLALIWKHAPYVVLIFGVLIIVILWAAYNRFGPPLVVNHQVRRSLVEHLDACGRYHWQQNRAQALLQALREQLVQVAEKRHPRWRQISRLEQLVWLAQRSKLSQQLLSRTLDYQPETEAEFTQIVQTIQRLRKTL